MSARLTGALVSLLSVTAVVAVVLWEWETGRGSPGPLSPVHSGVSSPISCEECHGTDGGMAAACGECHAEISAQRSNRRGLHGGLDPDIAKRCGLCHVEHLGDEAPLVSEQSFQLAGFLTRADYRHDDPFPLQGAHSRLACVECHENAEAKWVYEGEKRFLGLETRCQQCHEDHHNGAFGDRCESCHGQEQPFVEAPGFQHARFHLAGAHADLSCDRCHSEEPYTVARLVAEPTAEGRTCASCHGNPHGESGTGLFLQKATDCRECHNTRAFAGVTFGAAEHAERGIRLTGAHKTAPCSGCHTREAHSRPGTQGDLSRCVGCHDNPHSKATAELQFALDSCDRCHTLESFVPVTITAKDHASLSGDAAVGFELHGPHAELACSVCHSPTSKFSALVEETTRSHECSLCHESPHDAAFLARFQATVGVAEGRLCVECHSADAESFRYPAAEMTPAAHALTRFALDEPHARLECASCHGEPRTPEGVLREFRTRFPGRDSNDCSGCHGDPHATVFESAFAKSAVCIDCHDRQHFQPTRFSTEQHARTGYPLRGAHATLPCSSCHSGSAEEPEWTARSTECSGCHTDVHLGAFDQPRSAKTVDGRHGCARCHNETTFRELRMLFDHEKWTRFQLTGVHASLDCKECHDSGSRRRQTSLSCAGCHEDPHGGQFQSRGVTDCAACHRDSQAFAPVAIDHDSTRFPLDATHKRVPCSGCHKSHRTKRGEEVVRYRPLGTACAECHGWEKR